MRQHKILSRVGTADLSPSQVVRKDVAVCPPLPDKRDRGGDAGQHSGHRLGAAGGEKVKKGAYLTKPTGARNEVFFYFITFRI